MSNSQATHVVEHNRLYMAVGKKLKHVPKGTQIVCSKEQAKKLGPKVKPIGDSEGIDISDNTQAMAEAEKAVKTATAELDAAKKEAADAKAELDAAKKEAADAKAELEALKNKSK